MFSATGEAGFEDGRVDEAVELERLGLGPGTVRPHSEGEEAPTEGAGDDRFGELHFATGAPVPQLVLAQ